MRFHATGILRLAAKVIIVTWLVLAGWMSHDLWQFHHTYVVSDLKVVAVDTPQFVLESEHTHESFVAIFCPDYIPKFKPGMRIRELVYEDRGACWSISNRKLGYIMERN